MTRAEDCMARIVAWSEAHMAGEVSDLVFSERVSAIANQYRLFVTAGHEEIEDTNPPRRTIARLLKKEEK